MLHFNFDEMAALHQRSPEMFEQRRIELINAAIERSSGPQREALVKLQHELDQVRDKQPEHFMATLFGEMSGKLKELSKAWTSLGEKIE